MPSDVVVGNPIELAASTLCLLFMLGLLGLMVHIFLCNDGHSPARDQARKIARRQAAERLAQHETDQEVRRWGQWADEWATNRQPGERRHRLIGGLPPHQHRPGDQR
jgi:hypothetical protein